MLRLEVNGEMTKELHKDHLLICRQFPAIDNFIFLLKHDKCTIKSKVGKFLGHKAVTG
jgi:hypothetical protein